jgi:hypothetical protein
MHYVSFLSSWFLKRSSRIDVTEFALFVFQFLGSHSCWSNVQVLRYSGCCAYTLNISTDPQFSRKTQLLWTCAEHSFPLSLHFPRKLCIVRDFMGDFSSLYLLKNHMVAPRHMVEFVDTPCRFSSSWLCPLLPSWSDSKVDIVLYAGSSKVVIFWDVTHCSRVEIYRRWN